MSRIDHIQGEPPSQHKLREMSSRKDSPRDGGKHDHFFSATNSD